MLPEQTKNEVRKYKVTMPATVHVTVGVFAEDEDGAKLKTQRLVESAAGAMVDECLERADDYLVEQAKVYYPLDVNSARVDDVEVLTMNTYTVKVEQLLSRHYEIEEATSEDEAMDEALKKHHRDTCKWDPSYIAEFDEMPDVSIELNGGEEANEEDV